MPSRFRVPSLPVPLLLPAFLALTLASAPALADGPAEGQAIFRQHCSLCHGLDGSGGRGPNLRRARLERAPTDAALKALIQSGIPPEMPDGWYLSPTDLDNLAAFVRSLGRVPSQPLPGDPARGAALYRRSGCSSCHTLDGSGSALGPDLSDAGARRGPALLRQTLLDPSKTLPDGFLMLEALTASGHTLRGIRLNEDTFTIQILDLMANVHSLRKSDLRSLKPLPGQTPMPSFANRFSPSDLDDLVAFLASRREQP